MKRIRNIRELELIQENLKFQEKLAEKELIGSSANILDNLTYKIKNVALDFGIYLTMQFISTLRKRKSAEKTKN